MKYFSILLLFFSLPFLLFLLNLSLMTELLPQGPLSASDSHHHPPPYKGTALISFPQKMPKIASGNLFLHGQDFSVTIAGVQQESG